MPNGVAYADGTLKIGDILIKIDGETVANGKHKKGLLSNITLYTSTYSRVSIEYVIMTLYYL